MSLETPVFAEFSFNDEEVKLDVNEEADDVEFPLPIKDPLVELLVNESEFLLQLALLRVALDETEGCWCLAV